MLLADRGVAEQRQRGEQSSPVLARVAELVRRYRPLRVGGAQLRGELGERVACLPSRGDRLADLQRMTLQCRADAAGVLTLAIGQSAPELALEQLDRVLACEPLDRDRRSIRQRALP